MEEQTRSEILKTIPYGFYITGVVGSDGEANGFTTCWVSQVSFEPQQVVVAVRKDQHTHDLLEAGGVFSLNFLDTEQEDLARRFTRPLQPENGALGRLAIHGGRDGRAALHRGVRPPGVQGGWQDGGGGPYRLPRGGRRRQPRTPRGYPHGPRYADGLRWIVASKLGIRLQVTGIREGFEA